VKNNDNPVHNNNFYDAQVPGDNYLYFFIMKPKV